jgi:plasmid maintenance system antidote protein VapI
MRAGITPDVSIRLSQALGQPTSDIWFMMQSDYDFWQVSRKRRRKVRELTWEGKWDGKLDRPEAPSSDMAALSRR